MIRHNLYKRGKWWWVDFTWQNERRRIPLRTSNKRDVEELAAIQIRDAIRGAVPIITLGEIMLRYLNTSRVEKKSWQSDKTLAKQIMEFFGAEKSLSEISSGDVQDFKTFLSQLQGKRGQLSHATVNGHLALLKTIFNKAMDWEPQCFKGPNPCSKVKLYRESPRQEYFSPAEIRRLLEVAAKISSSPVSEIQRYFVMILTMAVMTGMRLGEILNLRWSDLKNGFILLRSEISKPGRSRLVPAAPGLLQALTRMPSAGGEYVFPIRRNAGVIRPTWKRVKALANVKPAARFHDLRHTFASLLVQRGVDLATVRELLCHSSLAMTQIYSHSSQEKKLQAVQSLDFV